MGSPLGPVTAGNFKVDLERNVIPKLSTHMTKWKRYVDDAITYIKPSSIDYVLYSYETLSITRPISLLKIKKDNKISFLDVLILRNGRSIENTVYRKFTHDDVCLHWDSFSTNTWKLRTLKRLLLRAFVVYSNEQLLNKEIKHLWNVFHHTSGYPKVAIQNVTSKFAPSVNITGSHQGDVSKGYLRTFHARGTEGEKNS